MSLTEDQRYGLSIVGSECLQIASMLALAADGAPAGGVFCGDLLLRGARLEDQAARLPAGPRKDIAALVDAIRDLRLLEVRERAESLNRACEAASGTPQERKDGA